MNEHPSPSRVIAVWASLAVAGLVFWAALAVVMVGCGLLVLTFELIAGPHKNT